MLAIQIEHVKKFMGALLLKESFDPFLLSEATITTFAEFHIDGFLHKDFFDGEDLEKLSAESRSLIRWKDVREHCLALIKGQRTPLSFRMVFQLPEKTTEKLVLAANSALSPEDVYGLFLNVQFRGGILTLTTGTSLRTFTLDKSLEKAWDSYISSYLAKQGLD